MISLFSTLIILLVCVFLFYWYNYLNERIKNFPPGPPKLPIWGSYWFVLKENYKHPHLAFENLAKRYKTDILGLYLGDFPTVVPVSYELCREALTRDEFVGRNDTVITKMRGLGGPRGIIFLDGPYWKSQRRFSLRQLRDFGFGRRSELVENFVIDEVKYLLDVLAKEPLQENLDFNPKKGVALMPDLLYGSLLNSIFMLLASTRFDNYKLREISRAGLRFQRSGDATGSAISMTPWLQYLAPGCFGYTTACAANEYMINFLQEIVEEHRQTFSDDHHRDFIDVFLSEQKQFKQLEGQGGFTDKQLLLVLLDYMFPSTIATGHTMNFYFAHLINNPHVQVKIQEEIERVVGRSRFPTLDDRKSMPYTEASIREGIRLIPLNPLGIPRRCIEDTTLGGYFIPKNTFVIPNVWTAHREEKIFGKHTDQFIPERFLDQNGNLLKKDYTIGFGAGKRLCAGETFARQNMFLMVAGLLQNLTIKSADGNMVDLTNNGLVPGVNISIDNNYILAVRR